MPEHSQPRTNGILRAAVERILSEQETSWAVDPSDMDQRFLANHYAAKLERIFAVARRALEVTR